MPCNQKIPRELWARSLSETPKCCCQSVQMDHYEETSYASIEFSACLGLAAHTWAVFDLVTDKLCRLLDHPGISSKRKLHLGCITVKRKICMLKGVSFLAKDERALLICPPVLDFKNIASIHTQTHTYIEHIQFKIYLSSAAIILS